MYRVRFTQAGSSISSSAAFDVRHYVISVSDGALLVKDYSGHIVAAYSERTAWHVEKK